MKKIIASVSAWVNAHMSDISNPPSQDVRTQALDANVAHLATVISPAGMQALSDFLWYTNGCGYKAIVRKIHTLYTPSGKPVKEVATVATSPASSTNGSVEALSQITAAFLAKQLTPVQYAEAVKALAK